MEYLTPVQDFEQFWFSKKVGVRGNRLYARAETEIVAMGLDMLTIGIQDTVLRNVTPQV